eukprot:6425390-Ditylum_brightwellii.AAC.1
MLQQKLLHLASSANNAIVLDYEYCFALVDNTNDSNNNDNKRINDTNHAWELEQKNIPAKNMGATQH